jgi:epoxyqueuosine reductase
MHYLHFQKHRRRSFTEILPGAKSIVVCALPFSGPEADPSPAPPAELAPPQFGKIARYAQGPDYHDVLKEKLDELSAFIDREAGIPEASKSLAYVDTGALPERAYAAQAGLGWIGKNAMLINPDYGSWFWLGEVITTAALPPSLPHPDRCGSCRKCIDACPTGAILEGVRAVDSRLCLSYLTIEHRGAIPEKFRDKMNDWIVGCDICQEACPWTQRSARAGRAAIGAPPVELLDLNQVSTMEKEEFKRRFGARAISRTKLAGLKRNANFLLEKPLLGLDAPASRS